LCRKPVRRGYGKASGIEFLNETMVVRQNHNGAKTNQEFSVQEEVNCFGFYVPE
jgi:hypothetical protein